MARVRPTLYVAAAQAGSEGLGLVRNVLIARALGPAEMGIVAAFTLTLSLLDMISDFGPDRLLVQAEDGDDEGFLSAAHSLLIWRGILSSSLLLMLSIPVGFFLKRPDATWMIAGLALVPLLRGALHLDSKRVQRHHDFRRMMIVELSAAVAATVVTLILVPQLKNASVLVWVSLFQTVMQVAVSHAVAERPYQLGMRREYVLRLLRFGWPLAVNGVIMFGALQGDRLVVLATATAAELGRYAVAFQLTMVPALLISRIASTVWLPSLSRDQSDASAFDIRLSHISETLGSVALLFSLGILTLGNPTIRMLYGPDFPLAPAVMSALGIMQGLRILRAVPSLAALSRADSLNPLASNVLRFLGIAAAASAGLSGGGLPAIAICGCGGEVIALAGSVLLLRKRHQIDTDPLVRATGVFALGTLAGVIAVHSSNTASAMRAISALIAVLCLVVANRRWWVLAPHRQSSSPTVSQQPVLAKPGN